MTGDRSGRTLDEAVVGHPYLDVPPVAMAHRGGGLGAGLAGLENSMRAFADAVELGYRYLETDLHATVDGVLVAFHDDTLDRVTDGSGVVARLPWEQVRRARIGGREPIPAFEELVATWPHVRLNLDVKSDRAVAPLVRVLQQRPALLERVCVGTFDQRRLNAIRRELGPGLCTAAGPREVRALWAASRGGRRASRVAPVRAHCLQIPEIYRGRRIVDARLVASAHARGRQVHVWTVNEPADMRRLLDLGVDGVITDATRALRDVLSARGVWRA